MLRRVGLHLRTVQRDAPERHRARFQCQPQDLLEEAPQRRQMLLAKVADRAKVRLIPGGQDAKRDVFAQPAIDLPRREDANAVGVHQHLGHHHRVIRRLPPLVVLVDKRDRRQVQLIDQVAHEVRQVIIRQPIAEARRQQQILLRHVRAIRFGHRP